MPQSGYFPFNRSAETDIIEGSSVLHKQLGDMQGEVKELQMELAAMKKDKLSFLSHAHKTTGKSYDLLTEDARVKLPLPEYSEPSRVKNNLDDTSKEITKLQEELAKAKNNADDERIKRKIYEDRLRDLEFRLNNICSRETLSPSKCEIKKYSDEEVSSLKVHIRDMKDEMEEMRQDIIEKTEQLQEYRGKYLSAQQHVEELKRQLDIIDYDNKQVSDQIQIEIQKMKMQFQEKLQELAPLPDLLKGAQMQLQEAKKLQKLAEDNSQQLADEVHRAKDKLVNVVSNLNQEKTEKTKLLEEVVQLRESVTDKRREIDELNKCVEEYRLRIYRLEEKLNQQDARFMEKSSECAQMLRDLEELKVESSRSITRSKERSDSMRRYMQTQISELERQLVQSRAQCKACQRERDDIRQRMQIQINSLEENFELVEMRLRTLQGQVSSLKGSYSALLAEEDENLEVEQMVVPLTTFDK